MKYLTLEMIKTQCNIDLYFTDEDNYLIGLGTVAEEILAKNVDDNLDAIVKDNGGKLPAPLIHAALMNVAHWYRNRESVAFASTSAVPLGYDFLISQFKNYTVSKI